MMTMMMLACSITAIFLFLNHPLSLGMMLLIQTLTISLITGLMNYNLWFSYILFLVMVGGMLILFIYMTSIASNEKFKFSQKLFTLIVTMILLMIMFFFTDQFFSNNYLVTQFTIQNEINNKLSLTKYLNWPNNIIMCMMFIYLLITLIMVVKVTNIQHGPIRQKN